MQGGLSDVYGIYLKSDIDNVTKIELFFTGLQYAKFVPILALMISDSIMILGNGVDFARYNHFIKFSFWFQISLLGLSFSTNIIALNTCRQVRNHNIRDVLYLFILNFCALSGYAIGTVRGFLINKGTFYRTERNNSKKRLLLLWRLKPGNYGRYMSN